ncbi:MAG: DUF6443 domain-containing protein [Ferruginibacter sp.]
MIRRKSLRLVWLIALNIAGFTLPAFAQSWNPGHKVGTINGLYNYSYNQIPAQLVEIFPAGIPNTGLTYEWEQSVSPLMASPVSVSIAATYTFTVPLTQTTYYRRKTQLTPTNFIYSNIIKIQVVSQSWEDINYVREHDVLIPSQTDWKTIDQLVIGSKLQSTTYLDGLGRPVQKVGRETALLDPAQPNNLWADVVQFSTYDAFGRQNKQYLPYTTTTETGKYKTSPTLEQPQYYTTRYNETSAFSNVATYDNSPLNRPLRINSPGTSWASGAGNQIGYESNDATDNVQIFSIGYNSTDLPVSSGVYPDNTLYKIKRTDENGKLRVEYTDKNGRLILEKVQLDNVPVDAYNGWICTYSVYDDFNQLRFRMQPEAVKWLSTNSWNFATTNGQKVADEWCFRYEYDEKGRTTLKKAPGAKELRMVYDSRDRVVFMQDGNQRLKSPAQWTANLYDELDRPVITTLYNTTKTIAQLQADIDNAVTLTPVTVVNPGNVLTDLVVNNRVAGITSYVATNSIEFVADAGGNFESLTGDNFEAKIDAAAVNPSITVNAATYKNPISAANLTNTTVTTILKYFYYDNYTYANVKPFTSSFDNAQAYSVSDPIAKTNRTINMPTGEMVRVLGTATFLTSTFYYDEKGRPIQVQEENIKSGIDITTSQYQWDGRLLSTASRHTTGNSGYSNFPIITKNIFDKIGRITSLQKKIGSNAFKTIATYDLDDMGRLKAKHLDPGYTNLTTGKAEMEALSYSYNIQSQITGINKDYALKTGGVYSKWGNYFGLCLGFDKNESVFTNTKLDGTVAGIAWNTQGDDAQRKYDFTYDNAGRLTNALFTERQNTTEAWLNTKMDFSVSGYNGKIEYDLNGNLLAMLQKGVLCGNPTPMIVDDLRYTYSAYSNKLTRVTDMGNLAANNGKLGDFADGSNGTGDDYVYDDNGNLIIDLNKGAINANGGQTTALGIAGIKYNFLDKPEEIKIIGKGTIKMVYDADGNKLQKLFTKETTSITTATTYINQYVYEETIPTSGGGGAAVLAYINFEEGRLRVMQALAQNNGFDFLTIDGNADLPNAKRGAWDFFVRDYQGNVRMILTEETHIGSNSCTLETQRATNEEPLFGKVDANGTPTADNEVKTRFDITGIPGQTSGNGWTNNTSASVSRIGNLAPKKVGPNALMKVMAGDEVSANTMYYYKNPVVNSPGGASFVNDIITGLVNAISGSGAASSVLKGNIAAVQTQLTGSGSFPSITNPDYSNGGGNMPKAYLSVMFFDERFNIIVEGSATQRVIQAGPNAPNLTLANIKAPKNGYCFVYVSNESDEMVFFDNLQVTQNHARIIEENHYYAYGLKIAAISSRKLPDLAEGAIKNNNLYNDKELIDDADLGWYDYGFRSYDPQIGRFPQLDPLTDDYPELTPYQYASCEPIANIDIDGLEKGTVLTTGGSLAVTIRVVAPEIGSTALRVVAKEGAKVVAMNIAKKPSLFAKLVKGVVELAPRVFGTIGLVFMPLQAGPEGNWENQFYRNPNPFPQPQPNPNPKDEDDDDNKPKYIYRSMMQDSYGNPVVGESRRMLGVVPEDPNNPKTKGGDIIVNAGNVETGTGGMSASPSILGLPKHRKPALYGGTGKDPVFRIRLKYLGPKLKFVPDSPNHGTIQPATNMTYEEYKKAIQLTILFWRKF